MEQRGARGEEADGELATQAGQEVTPPLTRSVVLLFAVACGLSVANVYYAQPLLQAMAVELGIPAASIGIVVTVTQAGYGLGLLLVVPLGDVVERRRLIMGQLLLSVGALVLVGFAHTRGGLLLGMAVVGLLAVVTQVLVAFAATLASAEQRGTVVGTVTGGVVLGILVARTVSGVVADLAGWRAVYLLSALLTVGMAAALFRVLPRHAPAEAALSYSRLLRSVFDLFVQERLLRVRGVLAMLIFAAFSTFWTSLVLPLSAPPLSLSATQVGLFGLVGAAGALGAVRAGQLADRGLGQATTGSALVLLWVSWLPIGLLGDSLWALVVGVILLDLAIQAVHVTNQSMLYSVRPEARSRLVAGYMFFYSVGSGAGAIASTLAYAHWGWTGVCVLGASFSAGALTFWAFTRAPPKQTRGPVRVTTPSSYETSGP
ncbi:MFS transporter [Citreicoccus inhibens]|uniref:MFS transporter n=1 Tax=Citreicoccus inhibens TaxID=2849499 RepID=UPI001F3871AE|nr:MFS transporter [Citreicoccus inhibens]